MFAGRLLFDFMDQTALSLVWTAGDHIIRARLNAYSFSFDVNQCLLANICLFAGSWIYTE